MNPNLSPAERTVLRCYVNSMPVKVIADILGKSVRTVGWQLCMAQRKLGLPGPGQWAKITKLAIQMNLIPYPTL